VERESRRLTYLRGVPHLQSAKIFVCRADKKSGKVKVRHTMMTYTYWENSARSHNSFKFEMFITSIYRRFADL
jgi:hypothetical protein